MQTKLQRCFGRVIPLQHIAKHPALYVVVSLGFCHVFQLFVIQCLSLPPSSPSPPRSLQERAASIFRNRQFDWRIVSVEPTALCIALLSDCRRAGQVAVFCSFFLVSYQRNILQREHVWAGQAKRQSVSEIKGSHRRLKKKSKGNVPKGSCQVATSRRLERDCAGTSA